MSERPTNPGGVRAAAVVVAAGRGVRLGAPEKALLPLAGRPMLAWSLDALQAAAVAEIVVVAGDHTREAVADLLATGAWPKARRVVEGGARRQDSVLAGLRATDPAAEVVVIHDAARPLAPAALFDACIAAAAREGAAIAAVPVADTLKRAEDGRILTTVNREGLWAAQTPQAFRRQAILDLFAGPDDATLTDEAARYEARGVPVAVVEGSPANLKVTRPADVAIAEALLRAARPNAEDAAFMDQRMPRSGIGYDVHRFAAGRRLMLGGVEIPSERGLAGHSDADALLHAIADAVLGAAGLGDIGRHFPPSDPRFEDADSRVLLREAVRLARAAGFVPVNVDATVIAEAPKIGPHVDRMRAEIAACLGVNADAVGVKATTNEGMGFVGRGEGVAALATALLAPLPREG